MVVVAVAVAVGGWGLEQVPRNVEKDFVREREERHYLSPDGLVRLRAEGRADRVSWFEVSCDVVDAVTPHEVQNSDLSHSHGEELVNERDTHHSLPNYNMKCQRGFEKCYGSPTVVVFTKASQSVMTSYYG